MKHSVRRERAGAILGAMTDPEMRRLAARFDGAEDADAAERELRGVLDVQDADIRHHALGGELGVSEGTVLAGRFRQERLVFVEDVIRHHGGEIVTDVPESWTGEEQ